ncbi:MFS transporter [Chamaesiphon sp. GL140_3_metabinner_50]|uniref:MFS transporter n=1 Tax=Chamaesiphon sp. GL140_3_metabinner_50 TaxID=2970812 RepID=UPI0025D3C479|nr:MFS transporter [Chamaesiphon sp. GL140_3_metabinner_50]
MRLSDFDKVPESELTDATITGSASSEIPADPVTANGDGTAIQTHTDNLEPQPGFFTVLKNRNFVTLWSGQIFSQLADKVYVVLMIAIIESRFQSENQSISAWVSAILIANTIPAVLFGSLAGVFVDRWHKKEVLVITNLFRGGLVLVVPFLLWLTKGQVFINLPLGFEILLAVTFMVSTLGQFFAPAEQSAISMIVDKPNLLAANSLYTTTAMGSLIVGFAIGEPILALADSLGASVGLGVNIGKELLVGTSYVIAGIFLLVMRTGETKQILTGDEPHVLADLQDGIRYLGEHKQIKGALIQLVIIQSVIASMTVVAVRMAELLPEIKASQFGFLLAAGGVGMGLGAVALSYLDRKLSRTQLSLYGSLGVAASLIGLSFSQSLWLSLLCLVGMGVFSASVMIPMQTTIQSETPEEMRGKVFGLQNNAINIALSLPLALTGIAETALGVPTVLLSLAAITAIGGIFTQKYNSAD